MTSPRMIDKRSTQFALLIHLLINAMLISCSGCAIVFSAGEGKTIAVGVAHLEWHVSNEAIVLRQQVVGVDLRFLHTNCGLTIGYSSNVCMSPPESKVILPTLGFYWPASLVWQSDHTNAINEFDLIWREIPSCEGISFTHHTRAGLDVRSSQYNAGTTIGWYERTLFVLPEEASVLGSFRYHSDEITKSSLKIISKG